MTGSDINAEVLARLQPMARLSAARRKDLAAICARESLLGVRYPLPLEDWKFQAVYLLKGQLKLEGRSGAVSVIVGGSKEAATPLSCRQDAPRAAATVTPVEVLRLDNNLLDLTVTWDEMARQLDSASMPSGNRDWSAMGGMLGVHSLAGVFASLPAAHIEQLLGKFEALSVQKGETVIRQGGPGDYYYVVERGRCKVDRKIGGTHMPLAELATGDAFGEEALISDAPRNATVTMQTDGVLLRLKKSDFLALLREPYLQPLSWEDAQAKVAAGACWLDVRFPAEFQQDGLPGAKNIPLNELRQALALLDESKEYIVYCQTGRRSSAAAFLMAQKGLRAFVLAEPGKWEEKMFGGVK
ncbi:MAG: cyclic nucleotide-binding domain-containing protein [Rhodocyclaceae bacterium]|nr:MAG: cyclic nucleotide-binding domain-containing protein [Rhodocyclaceae bacterium]